MDAFSQNEPMKKAATPWRFLLLLIAMTAIGPATLNILVPALPHLTSLLAADTGTVQLMLSLYLLSLAGAQLLLGPLSDRFGRRPVVLAGLSLNVLASLAAIASVSIGALIVTRILQAIGASSGIVIGRAMIRDLYERDHAAAVIGLVTAATVIAPMIAPLVGGILDTTFGWPSIFLFIALYSSAALLWALLVLPETRTANTVQTPAMLWREWAALLRNFKFHSYALTGAIGSAPFFTFLGGGPHVVVTQMGRSSAEFGLWFACSSFGYMSGNFTVSRLSERYGIDRMIMVGIVFEIVGAVLATALAVVLAQPGPASVFLPQIVISYGNGLLLPTAIAGAVSVRPQAAGAASGMVGCVQMALGAAVAQVVTVALAGTSGALPMDLMMLTAAALTGVAFALLAKPKTARL